MSFLRKKSTTLLSSTADIERVSANPSYTRTGLPGSTPKNYSSIIYKQHKSQKKCEYFSKNEKELDDFVLDGVLGKNRGAAERFSVIFESDVHVGKGFGSRYFFEVINDHLGGVEQEK